MTDEYTSEDPPAGAGSDSSDDGGADAGRDDGARTAGTDEPDDSVQVAGPDDTARGGDSDDTARGGGPDEAIRVDAPEPVDPDLWDDDSTGPGDTGGGIAGDVDEGLQEPTPTDPEAIDPQRLALPEQSLHPRIRIVWVFRAILTAAIAGGVIAALDAFWLDVGYVLPAGVTALLLLLGVPHAILRYRVWRYEVRTDAIYLERGVLTRVRTVVPFVRIQHVDTRRGPIERVLGLSTLVVYTAGSRGADVTVPGLDEERATDLQARLKWLAIASEDDTAV